ncbi:MAG: NAD(+) synthase [Deltaproteobacteria bacterium]|nr:NAD(+) synthase [Deltaproteobacteria bacterium]
MILDELIVGGAALNQTPLDWKGNRENILAAIELAREEGVQVLCLPELCLTGYGCEDAFHGEWVSRMALQGLMDIAPATRGMAVAIGLPVVHNGQLFNCAALVADGRVAGLTAKRVLAGYGVYYEPRWFRPWPSGVVEEYALPGGKIPIGDFIYDLDGLRLGFEICEDAWSSPQWRTGQRDAPEILLNPSASHFAAGKYATVRNLVTEGSRFSHSVYLYANLLGNESGRLIFDGAVLCASDGRLLAENRRFSFEPVNLVSCVADLKALRLERLRLPLPANRHSGEPGNVVPLPFSPQQPGRAVRRRNGRSGIPDWETTRLQKQDAPANRAGQSPGSDAELPMEQAFLKAVCLGLWDYLRKSRSQGFALSLSGGVDSSTVAVLVGSMIRLALRELGWPAFRARLGHLNGLDALNPEEAGGGDLEALLTRRLLMTVYQASANSSRTTRDAAREVAAALGAEHLELDIEPVVQAYTDMVARALGRPLDWDRDDLALQNIQARTRSPGIWMLANVKGFLLLCTSNRSEIGVGYATMDGDTSGGLAPIAGANKTFLRHWLLWMERQGPPELGPLAALAAVNAQEPTAELRPPGQGQSDEKDLMPYAVLDLVEQAAIRDRQSPLEVWRTLLGTRLPGSDLTPAQAARYVETFFRLWSRTQWKRERLAPSFHLDDENLDPRTWCRFPILAGGYETELEELAQAARSGRE